jgi:Trk K+ transport system NAD-binding subunit
MAESGVRRRLGTQRSIGKAARFCGIGAMFALSACANHAAGLWWSEAVFAALQTFALGLDQPAPEAAMHAGGWAPAAIWVTRIANPLLVAESVLFGALLAGVIARPRILLDDHVVVIGAGSLGRTVAEQLLIRSESLGRQLEVVVIDRDPTAPHLVELVDMGAWVIHGDGTLAAVLREARIHRARAVIAVTADDVSNVASTWQAIAICGEHTPHIIAHVEDNGLRRTVVETLGDRPGVDLFSLYDEAGAQLVSEHKFADDDVVIIAGFGRLGRAVYRQLHTRDVLIVERVPLPRPMPERDGPPGRLVVGDVQDLETVDAIAAFIVGRPACRRVTVFVCTDQDVRNLDLALSIERRLAARQIEVQMVTRMLRAPPGDSEVLGRLGARTLSDVVGHSTRFSTLVRPGSPRIRAVLARAFLRFAWFIGAM